MADSDSDLSLFDRFAEAASMVASRAAFFTFCVVLIVVWAPTRVVLPTDTWQLVINTITTIITFLMVALLQNTQTRKDLATQCKLNAVADALSDFMEVTASSDGFDESDGKMLLADVAELRSTVGIEKRLDA